MSRFPAAFRPPAFASWPSCSRRGFGLPHSRPTGQQRCRISTGFTRSTRARNDRGGRPLYPGDGGVLPVEGSLINRHLPLPSGQSLHPAGTSHRRDPNVTRHHRGFTHVHPSGLPLACDPRMGLGPWASSLSFAPRRCRRRTSGRGQAMDTGQELHLRHQSNLQSVRPLISCDLVSHRAGVPGRVAPLASPTADSSHLPYRHRPLSTPAFSLSPKPFRGLERSSPTISTCFTYPQQISRIRCSTHLLHHRYVPPPR